MLEFGVDLLDEHHYGDGKEPGNQVGRVALSDVGDNIRQGLGGGVKKKMTG